MSTCYQNWDVHTFQYIQYKVKVLFVFVSHRFVPLFYIIKFNNNWLSIRKLLKMMSSRLLRRLVKVFKGILFSLFYLLYFILWGIIVRADQAGFILGPLEVSFRLLLGLEVELSQFEVEILMVGLVSWVQVEGELTLPLLQGWYPTYLYQYLLFCQRTLEKFFWFFFEKRWNIAHWLHDLRQESLINKFVIVFSLRSVPKYNCFCLLRVSWEHSPVNESTVSYIRVADIFCRHCQEITYEGFELIRIFQVNLDSWAENLELDSSVFIFEVGNPFFESGHGNIIDFFSIFSQNPDSSFFRLTLSGKVKKRDEVKEHAIKIVLWRIFPENILHGLS